jgi:hypothetical protein
MFMSGESVDKIDTKPGNPHGLRVSAGNMARKAEESKSEGEFSVVDRAILTRRIS